MAQLKEQPVTQQQSGILLWSYDWYEAYAGSLVRYGLLSYP